MATGKMDQLNKRAKVEREPDNSGLLEQAATHTVTKEKKEAKSEQYVALLRPTTKANVKKIAKVLNKSRPKNDKTSLNDIINELLDQYVEEHEKELRQYDAMKGEFDD